MNPSFDYNKTYYKITNKEENHNGFQFKDGLNIDTIPFNTKICSAGGIYFSDIRFIFQYLRYNDTIGYYIRVVTVPEDAEVSIEGNKYKASKIILGERKELDLNMIRLMIIHNADMHINNYEILLWACCSGRLEIVKHLLERYMDFHFNNECPLQYASTYGHLEVVRYLVEHGADIYVGGNYALKSASKNGHLEVVKYLIEQGADIHADYQF